MIAIRTMHVRDIPLGLALCRFAGWNQIEDDWRRLLALNPESVFVAEYDGQPCGTASVTCYGTELAWIGMILVHPDHRRRGVASILIRTGLDYLQTAQLRCVRLDATEQGRLVYLKLGFEDERPICRYVAPRLPGFPVGELPPIEETDWENIARTDLDVVGADRLRLLRLLARDGATAVVKTSRGIRGYGFARRGFSASFLGPIVADGEDVAHSLAASLLARFPERGHGVYWDVLTDNAPARELAESLGFHIERRLTRMRCGTPDHPGTLNMVYGAAGFEVG